MMEDRLNLKKILAKVHRQKRPKNADKPDRVEKCTKNARLTSTQLRLLKYPFVTSTNISQYQ